LHGAHPEETFDRRSNAMRLVEFLVTLHSRPIVVEAFRDQYVYTFHFAIGRRRRLRPIGVENGCR
jgi:hypothetical protein